MAGMLLWRAGLLVIAAYSTFRIARLLLKHVDLPLQLEIGAGLALGGGALVLGSVIWERVLDARAEGDLLE